MHFTYDSDSYSGLLNFQKKKKNPNASLLNDCATIKPVSLVWRVDGRDGGRATTKAICRSITKDYAWMGLAFDAFEDDQTEA